MIEQPSDEQLLGRFSTDPRMMQVLIDRHGAYLYGIARTLTQTSSDADDAVQETLMALLNARFDGRSSARTFMVSILIRQAAMLRRKRRGWLKIVSESPEPECESNDQQAVDAKIDLAGLLEKLSLEHREVIVMRELQGMNYDEMAAILDVPRGTVESRLFRARERLRQLWQK